MENTVVANCWQCGHALSATDIGRELNCLGCGRPTRVCRNCRWYAPGRPHDCAEPIAEPVQHKDQPNFCEQFEPTTRNSAASSSESSDAMRAAAEALFK